MSGRGHRQKVTAAAMASRRAIFGWISSTLTVPRAPGLGEQWLGRSPPGTAWHSWPLRGLAIFWPLGSAPRRSFHLALGTGTAWRPLGLREVRRAAVIPGCPDPWSCDAERGPCPADWSAHGPSTPSAPSSKAGSGADGHTSRPGSASRTSAAALRCLVRNVGRNARTCRSVLACRISWPCSSPICNAHPFRGSTCCADAPSTP
jgi:hypothetical protein